MDTEERDNTIITDNQVEATDADSTETGKKKVLPPHVPRRVENRFDPRHVPRHMANAALRWYQQACVDQGITNEERSTSSEVMDALNKEGYKAGLAKYVELCRERAGRQLAFMEKKYGASVPPELSEPLQKLLTAGFMGLEVAETAVTIGGKGKEMRAIEANDDVVDWVGGSSEDGISGTTVYYEGPAGNSNTTADADNYHSSSGWY